MKKEIIINATSDEIRVALIEDNKLAEIFLEVPDKERHVGSIYLGRVERVVQGMNASFVNIGEAQDAFLHFSDVGTALDEFRDLLDERDDDEGDDEEAATKKPIPKKGAKPRPGTGEDATDDAPKKASARKEPAKKKESAPRKGSAAAAKKGPAKKGKPIEEGAREADAVDEKKPPARKPARPDKPTSSTPDRTDSKREKRKPEQKKGARKEGREPDLSADVLPEEPEQSLPLGEDAESPSGEEAQKRKRRRGRRGGRNRRKKEGGVDGDGHAETRDHHSEEDAPPVEDHVDAEPPTPPSEFPGEDAAHKKKRRRGRRGRGKGRREESEMEPSDEPRAQPIAEVDPPAAPKAETGSSDRSGRAKKRPAPREARTESAAAAEPTQAERSSEPDVPSEKKPATKKARAPRATSRKTSKKESTAERTDAPEEAAPPPTEEKKKRPARKRPTKKKDPGSSTMDAKLPTFQTKRSGEVTIALEKGQDVIVQVTRESYASKGVRVSTKVSLPGRFLVLLPLDPAIGISRKVQNMKERRRLRRIARSILPEGHGCIIRTNAENKDEELIRQDLQQLIDKWQAIENKVKTADPPMLLYTDQSIANTVMRDLFTPDIERVVIDNRKLYNEIREYVEWAAPGLAGKVEYYQGSTPIFDKFGVEQELQRMFERKIYIPAGGYIILDQTEAMMVIDVNSGRYAGKKDQELNSLRTNLESAREIARQIRLRDIGGLLVIDFIDLYDEKNRKKVYDELKRELKRDRAKSVVLPMTQFGLVQMTRQRIRQQIVQTMSEPCPSCSGTGMVQSKATVLRNIERWLSRFKEKSKEFRLTLAAHPLLIDYLTEGNPSRLTQVMVRHFVRLKVVPDESVPMGQFHFYSARRGVEITSEFMNNRKK